MIPPVHEPGDPAGTILQYSLAGSICPSVGPIIADDTGRYKAVFGV
jgi:hypothetical protein